MAALSLRELREFRERCDMVLRHSAAVTRRAERAMARAEKAVAQALAAFERAMILCDRISRRRSN